MATAQAQGRAPQLTGFSSFGDLPTEVRLMIWKCALQMPKVFMVDKRKPLREDRNFGVRVHLGHVFRACREANDLCRDVAKPAIARWQQRIDTRTNNWGDTTENRIWRTPREMGWNSALWAYFDPQLDSVYLDASAVEAFDHESAETLEKLVGPIKRIIVPHHKINDPRSLFGPLWNKLDLESVSLLKATASLGETASSLLSQQLKADLPLVVSIEDSRSVKVVEDALGEDPELLKHWNDTLAWYDRKGVGMINGYLCNWTEFRSSIRADWLGRVPEWCPFAPEDGPNPPIDEDGLILDYQHPWVKQWAASIPQFKAVVMFITSEQESQLCS
ncbi:hypothetical protein BKA67DRAFT_544276 [Truncatella angustata]|uniref:2EXR domain-containing protein n=1 Tax=Truncatella angustata TaxID=152316 RepID=A0A9P8UWC2_9PEZI|nr:uncharacterized protein BKA67DRAFT_544276 [Truncatella angustata]KAH6659378.1 hypothetical protein BKA67DRAFT_544276 [Truncatella angustata]KAH8205612.1 hypothetical protein TruAng_000318 [Truncatella angustata]